MNSSQPDPTCPVHPPEALYGVLGHPVGHSLSPILHSWALAELGSPGAYMRWDIRPVALDAFMLAVRTLPVHGASVTLPYKQRIIPYLDHLTPEAKGIRAVNTLFWERGALWGDNTDCLGILRPLKERGIRPDTALVLGAGGAALAAVRALRRLGCPGIRVAARDQKKAAEVFPELVCVPWEELGTQTPDLVLNTTPLGMRGDLEGLSPWPDPEGLLGVGCVFDLVYTPLETKLLQEARAAGCRTVSGLEMFVHQALGQTQRWIGRGFDPGRALSLLTGCLQ
ncbi:shikimate dehydrogenase [Desulfovermiculus halophilus]|uniref:shikimate dehydrogenase n=1 Tax=Desulfovermiculus halophilus TaxID=339722 RepID=UPI0006857F94|nr:shikimate dehydrogenase [Desulfovermiculus halophilus]